MKTVTGQRSLDRFLRSLRRRVLLVRAMEGAGWGLVCGSVLSVALAAVGAAGAATSAFVLLALGVVGGLAQLIWSMQTLRLFDVALLADRQLDLGELLSSAVSCASVDDDFATMLRSMADRRSMNLTPRQVILHRIGARGWSGIGLASVAGLAVASLIGPTQESHANGPTVARARASTVVESSEPFRPGSADAPTRRPDSQTASSSGDHTDIGATSLGTGGNSSPSSQEGEGVGGASAMTDDRSKPPSVKQTSPSREASSGKGVSNAGLGAASQGDSRNEAVGGIVAPSERSVDQQQRDVAAWETAKQQADRAVRNDAVPDSARDVVREYFAR